MATVFNASEIGRQSTTSSICFTCFPRAGAIRDTRGIIKMTADANSNEVLGVSMVGHNAGEVIHEAAMAMR
jgi:mercuric reductase